MQKTHNTIAFVGGGTLGPVTPLLAIFETVKKQSSYPQALWFGTSKGPERAFVEEQGATFIALPHARLPRYASIDWITLPFTFAHAFVLAFFYLLKHRPFAIASAGGYSAVPVILAGWILRIPSWVHQQDARVLLTTRLTTPFASWVTSCWNTRGMPTHTEVIGNPVRPHLLEGDTIPCAQTFHFDVKKPLLLVFGGGTGSAWINAFVEEAHERLQTHINIVHLTGMQNETEVNEPHYVRRSLLIKEMADVYACADIVLSRAGMGTITELAALHKPAILVPIPGSIQEDNVKQIEDAVISIDQRRATTQDVVGVLLALVSHEEERKELGNRLHQAVQTDCAEMIVHTLMKWKK